MCSCCTHLKEHSIPYIEIAENGRARTVTSVVLDSKNLITGSLEVVCKS